MIKLENVSKAYSAGIPALNDVSLYIEPGEFVFVVGDSGSGKSTLIKLLLKELEPTKGSITISNQKLGNIRHRDIPRFRRNIGVVFQDFQVFAFPLGENVAAGSDVDSARAVDALDRAGVGERYRALPDGLDTSVGKEFDENGVAFSGGEKQLSLIHI